MTLRSSCSAGWSRRASLSRRRYGASVSPRRVGLLPVADADLVLLRVEVLLAAGLDREVLEELVAGVHPPARGAGGRDGGPDLERRRTAVLEERVQDVGGVHEEVRPHHVRGLVGHLVEVLLELPAARAPGEVRVGLVEADRPVGAHPRRQREGLGQEEHVGIGLADPAEQPLPELERLGVRVVDAEDADAVGHPVADQPLALGVDALGVVVEVDRVDVLVLLRRVLGVGDGAVGAGGEPLRVLGRPRVVGRRLEGEVERDLEARAARPRRRRSRSPRWCRGRGGWRRARRPCCRSPRVSRRRPVSGSACCWRPCG